MAAEEGTPTIHLLDPSEAMKIAAGEVVERPASVVKELVENSLDAGSTRIRVEVSSSGKEITRMSVTDNGTGMNRADARLAFLPHATSKIRALSDLENTLSLGFRGEALASIAAVSQVTLVTRCRGEGCGNATRVRVRGGEVLELSDAGAPPGTTVVVEDLFYNTPARQKFLKSLQAEPRPAPPAPWRPSPSPIPRWSSRSSITAGSASRPAGAPTSLRRSGTCTGTRLQGTSSPYLPTTRSSGSSGYISTPFSPRKTPSRVHISINDRPVFSRQIMRAIRWGYGTLLPSHTYPVAFLDLRIDPSRVDVNVHPTKRHVRIGREQELLAVIEEAVREGLMKQDLTPPVHESGTVRISQRDHALTRLRVPRQRGSRKIGRWHGNPHSAARE